MYSITVLIATSQQRTDWLIGRSLPSVYRQEGISPQQIKVLIVDDNQNEDETPKIRAGIEFLRTSLALPANHFQTNLIHNAKTKHMSGTGGWNTGIEHIYQQYPLGFTSILDDDDEYLSHHLFDCIQELTTDTIAVFQHLFWLFSDGKKMFLPFCSEDLTPENFFIGNPGVQGSNMFFKTELLVKIQGFDETLPNTTDRDLMIRFLWYAQEHNLLSNIKIIENIGVKHYAHNRPKVNNNLPLKQIGLDLFYKRYRSFFSQEAYERSIVRAQQFFKYSPPKQL